MGSRGLNDRVRDGNGCGPSDITTRKSKKLGSFFDSPAFAPPKAALNARRRVPTILRPSDITTRMKFARGQISSFPELVEGRETQAAKTQVIIIERN